MPDLIDRAAGVGLRFPSRSQVVFPDGWGDRSAFNLLDLVEHPVAPVRPTWVRTTEADGLRLRRGGFPSPLPDLGHVPVELIEPSPRPDRIVIVFPAWNQEGLGRRRGLAMAIAQQGVAVALAEIPLYGVRRRHGASGMPIRTVSDFFVMGAGAILEAMALLAGFESDYRSLGVAGFSMGGNLAALTSAITPRPLATALMAAPHTPRAPYLEGNLSHAIRWEALGGRSARPELTARLGAISALAYPPRPHHRRAVLLGGTSDGFVPVGSIEELAAHWHAQVRWLRGGHGILWWRHQPDLVQAVVDSFSGVSADRGSEPG